MDILLWRKRKNCWQCDKLFTRKSTLKRHIELKCFILMEKNVTFKCQISLFLERISCQSIIHIPCILIRNFHVQLATKHLRPKMQYKHIFLKIMRESHLISVTFDRWNFHTGKGYKCEKCEILVWNKANLKAHMKTHKNIKSTRYYGSIYFFSIIGSRKLSMKCMETIF